MKDTVIKIGIAVVVFVVVADIITSLSVNPTRRLRKLNEATTKLKQELHQNQLKSVELRHQIDSLNWELRQSQDIIDSLDKEIQTSRQETNEEYKGIRYWSDAKRDSFWRAESSR